MNPHTYRRRKKAAVASPWIVGVRHVGSFAKDVFNAEISSLIAIAMVLFAAGSVAAASQVLPADVAVNIYDPIIPVSRTASLASAKGAVLGQAVYAAEVLTSEGYDDVVITAKPVTYRNDGSWTYQISWNRKRSAQGSVYVDGAAVASTAEASGSRALTVSAGSDAVVDFYAEPKGQGKLLVRQTLHVLNSPFAEESTDIE